jgi:hypothetical protein
MLRLPALALIASAALAAGCANLNQIAKTEQNIPITTYESDKKLGEAGAVYLWPPYSSAAVVDGKGNRCILAASGAKTIDASSEAALKLGKALEKIEGLDISIKNRLVESFAKISAADAHAAFVDVALFHLCILDQNGSFAERKKNDKGELVDHTFKANLLRDAYLRTVTTAQELK